jgi:hypothetical protein
MVSAIESTIDHSRQPGMKRTRVHKPGRGPIQGPGRTGAMS